MTLDEAVAEIEAEFDCQDGPAQALGPTGEPYVCVVSGGLKKEGERSPALWTTENGAVRAWVTALWAYAAERFHPDRRSIGCHATKLKLYWRIRPEIDSGIFRDIEMAARNPDLSPETFDIKIWLVYSRLLIVDEILVAQAA